MTIVMSRCLTSRQLVQETPVHGTPLKKRDVLAVNAIGTVTAVAVEEFSVKTLFCAVAYSRKSL